MVAMETWLAFSTIWDVSCGARLSCVFAHNARMKQDQDRKMNTNQSTGERLGASVL